MAAQRGRDLLIKLQNENASGYITAAGLRSKSIKFNAKPIDITHSESDDAWRELLPGGGIKSVEISGSGVFRDAASDAQLRSAFFDQSALNLQIIVPDFGMITGPFLINMLSYSGTYQGETVYEISLASAGKAEFAAL